jgi:hypothetical protein
MQASEQNLYHPALWGGQDCVPLWDIELQRPTTDLSEMQGEAMSCKDCPPEPIGLPEDGERWIVYGGGFPEHPLAMMQHTLPGDYTKGKFLSDGSLKYEKGPDDWEPPSPVEGYERDAKDPWLFRPLWKSCQLRMYSTVVKEACDCIQVRAMCNHPETGPSPMVDFEICEACQKRQPIQARIVPKRTPMPKPFTLPVQGSTSGQSSPDPSTQS